jgi:hypothetical protein
MERTVLTFVTLFVVTAARAADLATTLYFDPTLAREANPVVAQLGAGPRGMLVANLIGVMVFLLLPLLCFWRGPRKKFAHAPVDIWEFASFAFYDRLMPKAKLLRAAILLAPLPKDWVQVCRLWGVVGSWAIGFGSFAAAFSWWAISWWQSYHTLYARISLWHYPAIPPVGALVGAVAGWWLFVRCEFYPIQRERV